MPRRCFLPLCVIAALLAAPALADDFTVAALNDTHVTDSSKTALLDEAIKVINGSNARLTLVLGDLSATGSQEQMDLAKQSLDRLKMPYAVIPGNHDCPTNRPLPFADRVLALFAGHKLKLVAAGHWHGNQEETREGVLFVTTACCTMTRDNFDKSPDKGFRLFSFKGEAVESRFVPVKVPGW